MRCGADGPCSRADATVFQIDVARHLLERHSKTMTQKQLVLQAINELPDDVPLSEIVERVEFLAAIQKGLDQLDQGKGIAHEEVKRQLASWLAK